MSRKQYNDSIDQYVTFKNFMYKHKSSLKSKQVAIQKTQMTSKASKKVQKLLTPMSNKIQKNAVRSSCHSLARIQKEKTVKLSCSNNKDNIMDPEWGVSILQRVQVEAPFAPQTPATLRRKKEDIFGSYLSVASGQMSKQAKMPYSNKNEQFCEFKFAKSVNYSAWELGSQPPSTFSLEDIQNLHEEDAWLIEEITDSEQDFE